MTARPEAELEALAARDRLLLAATQLLDEARGGPVSTREITQRAGVRAPTLYHHFGSKQALLDAVASHGFKEFLRVRHERGVAGDPLADVRAGWDSHVAFGLEFPSAYTHIYGNVRPGVPCAVTADVRAHVLETLEDAERQGRLRVSASDAATQILAACSGVTLTLIQQPSAERDLTLSERMREAVLAAITSGPSDAPGADRPGTWQALDSVATAIEDAGSPLTPGERFLMHELLARLAEDRRSRPSPSPPQEPPDHTFTDAQARRIIERVRAIPEGTVRTFGDVDRRAPRRVGRILATTHDAPWHRVVRADGTLPQGERQRRLLLAEGVPMRGARVDLDQARLPPEV
jgi:AcrR family transcriptional regulator/alkylated DNA nucleotide flippase Atl1